MSALSIIGVALILMLPFIAIFVACRIYIKKDEEQTEKYYKELESLFQPGRWIHWYQCESREFDKWDKICEFKILKYSKGYVWCERYDKDGSLSNPGLELFLPSVLETFDRTELFNITNVTMLKSWKSPFL